MYAQIYKWLSYTEENINDARDNLTILQNQIDDMRDNLNTNGLTLTQLEKIKRVQMSIDCIKYMYKLDHLQ